MNPLLVVLPVAMFFLLLHGLATQKIYCSKYTLTFCLFIFAIECILYFLQPINLGKLGLWKVVSPLFFYSSLLVLIKNFYGKINSFLIRSHLINSLYSNKNFTFVHSPFEYGDDYWDERLASRPSWLDYLLTYSLLLIPILLMRVII